jgi:cell division protein FtsB
MSVTARHPGRLLARKRVLALNLAIFGLAIWGFTGEAIRNRDLRREIADLQERADQLAKDNLVLTRHGERIAEGQTMESEARLKLNMMKPGEQVVVIRGELSHAGAQEDAKPPAAPAAPESNAVKWWRYLFH